MKHEKIKKYYVTETLVENTLVMFRSMPTSGICEPFECPDDADSYKNVEIVDDLVLPKLDMLADWLKEQMHEEDVSAEMKEKYRDIFLYVAQLTNTWLKAVDADESEMYLLD